MVDRVTGLRVDGSRTSEVAAALVRLCKDPALAEEMGRNGRIRAREMFSWSRVAAETLALFD